ncbi:MAG: type II toxin-antitoxin system RelE/ParE family toxin [Gammaproteobacteria bacterium]
MRVKWTPLALQDLAALRNYIRHDNPAAAERVAKRILEAVDLLREQPGIGRPGRIIGTKELGVTGTPYIIPYRVRFDVIELLRVYHAAQKWPSSL